MDLKEMVLPGDFICNSGDGYEAGVGVIVKFDQFFSTKKGKVAITTPVHDEKTQEKPPKIIHIENQSKKVIYPKINSVIHGQVMRMGVDSIKIKILTVDGTPVTSNTYFGMLRKRDIKASEVDKIILLDCYKPGDFIRAKVYSLGDKYNYYLSTSGREFGVVFAKSTEGHRMVAKSWTEMICTKTKKVEKRKVADISKGIIM